MYLPPHMTESDYALARRASDAIEALADALTMLDAGLQLSPYGHHETCTRIANEGRRRLEALLKDVNLDAVWTGPGVAA